MTIKERATIERLEVKIDKMQEQIQTLLQVLAKNEAEHQQIFEDIKALKCRKSGYAQGIAWLAAILGVMLTLINIIGGIK